MEKIDEVKKRIAKVKFNNDELGSLREWQKSSESEKTTLCPWNALVHIPQKYRSRYCKKICRVIFPETCKGRICPCSFYDFSPEGLSYITEVVNLILEENTEPQWWERIKNAIRKYFQ